jgi:PAS domain S-box-containing protein
MDPAVYKDLWETISAGKKWRGEWMNKKKNGELYWEDVSITPIFGEKEKVTNYLAVKQDITQRKTSDQQILDLNVNLERKIAERENQYRSVVENVNEVIFQTDAQGLWLFLNKSWETVTGFSVDESLGQLFLNYVHPNDRQHNMELFEPLINREKEYCRHQIRYLTKDGGFRWIEVFARLGLNEKDEITGTYGTLQDITDTKRAVDELEESRERYRGLSEAAFDSIFFSEKGICIEQNQMARKVFGYTDEEAIGRYGTDWIVPADRPIVMKNMLSGMEEPYEVTALKKDGTTFPCMLCGKMMYYKGRDVRVTSLIDITERKLAEESIREARDAAEKANHAKSEFLSRMSHELRTPMNSILGFAQLMNMSGLSPAHRKSVNHIWNSGKHLLTLINEVLDISRIEAGKFAMSIEPVQIHGAISEMLEVVQPEAVKRNITTQMLHSPANELFVLADRQRFKQVLLNLIINAVKYNRDGGSVKIKCELIEKETHGISSVRVLIIDTGIGIKPENMEKLFLPFERIGAEKTITEGTGLGLTMVKMMMKGMGGTIGVESIYGEGSTFWVELPLAADKKIQKKISSDTLEKDTAENEQSGTILYIEDNILNIELVDEIINSHRPAIHLITSIFGSNAIKSATEYKPDLILLDLDLPDIKGTQVLANLQANDQTRSIPVVIVSADAMSDKIKQLMNAGARDYLTKPLDINLFLQVVDKWIGDKDKDTGLIKPPKE